MGDFTEKVAHMIMGHSERKLTVQEQAVEIIEDLHEQVQSMRAGGDTDLRTVLHLIDNAINRIDALED